MKYTPLVLLMGPIAFSVGKNHHLNLHSNHHHSRALDMTAGGYDKHPKGNFATSDGISPVPPIFENVLTTRNACNNGMVDCLGAQCNQCGSCCGAGKCAENFGTCCSEDTHCSFGFSCCVSSAGCCYEDTSFCCESSPTGCCLKGTQCTRNNCVGEPYVFLPNIFRTALD